jgi:hypothetical protein
MQMRQGLTWDVADTQPTINGVRRARAMIQKLCEKQGKQSGA